MAGARTSDAGAALILGCVERMLIASGFKLAQADPEGLAQFIDTVEVTHTKVTAPVQPAVALPETLRAFAFRWTGPEVPPEGEVRALLIDLHWYLGVEGYDLFCACAVYPELDWNLTLYMSQVMSTSDSKFQEKDLAKLARLPWFRRGRMPDWLRLLLLDDLGSERERLVRGALERLLLGQTGAHDIRFDLPLAAGNRETIEAIARSVLSELARQEVPSGPLRDPIFVSFMHSRPRDRLAVTLPARHRPPSDDRSALRALATPSRKREFADTGLGPSLAQQEPTRAGRPFWVYAVVFLYFSLVLLLYSVAVLNIAKDAAVTFLVFLFAVVSASGPLVGSSAFRATSSNQAPLSLAHADRIGCLRSGTDSVVGQRHRSGLRHYRTRWSDRLQHHLLCLHDHRGFDLDILVRSLLFGELH